MMMSPYVSSPPGSTGVSPEERESLIVQYAYLVKRIASRMAMRLPASVTFDELVSAGSLGLIDAVDKFNPERDVSLKTYAQYRIKGAILDELRSRDWYSRSMRKKIQDIDNAVHSVEAEMHRPARDEEIAARMGLELVEYQKMVADIHGAALLSLDAFLRNDDNAESRHTFQDGMKGGSDTPLTHVGQMELREAVADAIDRLNEKEKVTVSLYYYEELTLKEIGQVMGLTESRICQIHAMALVKLKNRLAEFR